MIILFFLPLSLGIWAVLPAWAMILAIIVMTGLSLAYTWRKSSESSTFAQIAETALMVAVAVGLIVLRILI